MISRSFSGDYDVVVVGGALVGGVLALSLANRGKLVAVIDAQALSINTETGHSTSQAVRTTAIAAGSVAILQALVPQLNVVSAGTPIRQVHVSQQGYFGSVRLNAEEEGVPALGYVVENRSLQDLLLNALSTQPQITLVAPAVVEDIYQDDSSVNVITDSGELRTPWLVGVDGVNSAVRRYCNLSVNTIDYDQCAVVSTVESELPHRQTAYERFTSQGPMAMLPLATHTLSLIFTVDAAQAETVRNSSDECFLQYVQQTFGHRLGRLSAPGRRQVFPLALQQSERQGTGRIVLMGNAVRSLHPVAGQGFNLAVRDIGKLLEIVDSDLFDSDIEGQLRAFQTMRESDQRSTSRLTDFFARSFRGTSPVLSHLRGLGLIGLDTVPGARRSFARRAMGLAVSLPDIQYPH